MKLNREQAIEIAGVTKGKHKMKTTRTLSRLGLFALASGLTFGASSAHAAIITQTVGNLDWNDAIWGSPAAAPTSGNDYVTATGVTNDLVRLSADGLSSTFGGDSLKVVSGTRALVKNINSTSTINGSLTLDGGAQLDHAPNNQNRSGTLVVTQLIVNGTGNRIGANTFTGGFTINGTLTGTGDFVVERFGTTDSDVKIIFKDINEYTGAITVNKALVAFGVDYTFSNTLNLTGEGIPNSSLNSYYGRLEVNAGQALTFGEGLLSDDVNGVVAPGTYSGASLDGLGRHFLNSGGTIHVIPEPSSLVLLGLAGLASLSLLRRRRR